MVRCSSGTHVAGTLAGGSVSGTAYGMAPGVSIVDVKILSDSGSGSISGLIAGINWAMIDHNQNPGQKSVGNMSIGAAGTITSLNNAVNSAVDAGIIMAVAAGNSNDNACNRSPAGASMALTVASSGKSDEKSYFSSWGSCVDLFAPGAGIYSAAAGTTSSVIKNTGTSMVSLQ